MPLAQELRDQDATAAIPFDALRVAEKYAAEFSHAWIRDTLARDLLAKSFERVGLPNHQVSIETLRDITAVFKQLAIADRQSQPPFLIYGVTILAQEHKFYLAD